MSFSIANLVILAVQDDATFRARFECSPVDAWCLAGVIWVLLIVYNFLVGWTQKQEANGSLRRLFWVSVFLGLIGTLPAIQIAIVSSRGPVLVDLCRVAIGSTLLNVICFASSLGPPVSLRGTKERLPIVTDHRFLARVADLAKKMNLAVPIVRLLPSVCAEQRAQAFAGTLQVPQLVVADGILNRLEPAECDAVIAHELGHIANGSLWLSSALIPIGTFVLSGATLLFPVWLAVPFGITFFVGFRRLVIRPIEFDCDHRAARAIGFRVTSSALAKTHSLFPISNPSFLLTLAYATSTHPSREARLAALFDAAPLDDRPDEVPDKAVVIRHRRIAASALALWILVLAGTLIAGTLGRANTWLACLLWIAGFTPLLLVQLAVRKYSSLVRKRMGQRRWVLALVSLVAVTLFGVGLVMACNHPGPPERIGPVLVVLVIGIPAFSACSLLLWCVGNQKRLKLQNEVAVAFQVHDFRRVFELCANSPMTVNESHLLRFQQAIAGAICGNRSAAIDALERLWNDKPCFPMSALALGELLLDSDMPERAIEVVKKVSSQLPRDPVVPLIESRAFRRLGRLDDALAACDRAMEFDPRDGCIHAVAAAIELERGHVERAEILVSKGLSFAPGEPYLRIVHAEIILRTGTEAQARLEAAQALRAVRANPLLFLQPEMARLEEELAKRFAPVVADADSVE